MIRYLTILFILLAPVLVWAAPGASPSSGVAPLAVHFDADVAATSGSSRPFHEFEYTWSFGDSSSGTWGTSGRSKNTDKGASAAHVYETAGTYTATLIVRDSNGDQVGSTSSFTITVSAADTTFASTATTCVSTGSDFTGCPSGAAQVTTSNLSGLSGYTDAGERVLLKRGDSWTVGSAISFPNNAGPVSIGAFGTCSSPDAETGICSNAPQVSVGGVGFVTLSQKSNWRVADLSIVGTSGWGIGGGWNNRDALLLRVGITGTYYGISWTGYRESDNEYSDKNAIVSCHIHDTRDYAAFVGSERLAVLGSVMADISTMHVLRVWQAYKSVIGHNILSGAGSQPGLNLKLHGSAAVGTTGQTFVGTYAQTVGTFGNGLRTHTQFVVIDNNVFGGSGPYSVSIGPQNGTYQEIITDVLVEKNKVIGDYGLVAERRINVGFYLTGRNTSIRNNIIDATGMGSWLYGIYFDTGPTSPYGAWIYNNTLYSSSSVTYDVHAIHTKVGTDVVIRNNYSVFTAENETLVSDESGAVTSSNNVSTNTGNFVDATNASPLLRDFSITSSASVAINQGYAVPLLDDFSGVLRTGTKDVGADSYETEASPTCDDLIQNGDETGVDCGGSCPNSCSMPPSAGGMRVGSGSMRVSTSSYTPVTPIQ